MDKDLPTVDEISAYSDISPLIREVLGSTSRTNMSELADVSAFLLAAIRVGRRSKRVTSATALFKAAGSIKYPEIVASKEKLQSSIGLAEAFSLARNVRRSVPGRDVYIGLRHVLASIVTAKPGTATRSEFDQFLSASSLDRQVISLAILNDVLSSPEPQENPQRWTELFRNAGVHRKSGELGGSTDASPFEQHLEPDDPIPGDGRSAVGPGGPSEDATPGDDDQSASALPAAKPTPSIFALAGADDPFDANIIDRTGARREAKAFARLATAKAFRPPIAIGVFGEWGSGKSFFLRLIKEEVALIAGESDAQDGAFHQEVVPITFNAWHYAETNLWASLVDHIFSELDAWSSADAAAPAGALLDSLSSSRAFTLESAEALVATRREQHEALARFSEAESELERARGQLGARLITFADAAWSEIWAAATQKDQIESAAKQLGIGEALSSAEEAKDALKELDREVGRLGIANGPFWRVLASGGVLALTGLLLLILPPVIEWASQKLLGASASWLALVGGIVAPVGGAVVYAKNTAVAAAQKLRQLGPLLEKAKISAQVATNAALEPAKAELAEKSAAAAEANAVFLRANERLAQASTDYTAGTGRARLLDFVRQRVAADVYGKHLGFIATIRRDFESLSLLMAEAGEGGDDLAAAVAAHSDQVDSLLAGAGTLLDVAERERLENSKLANAPQGRPFRRIVLYIDDLDRCAPDKVVEVLQAIHLLLAFPLFAVFVAVDVRWLKQALEEQYTSLIRSEGSATAFDYLEKIFQIPYWVRALDSMSTADILADRIHVRTTGLEAAVFEVPLSSSSPVTGEVILPEAGNDISADFTAAVDVDESLLSEPLTFTVEEAAYINRLSPCLAVSPRRVLRFVNTYAVIKASLPEIERRDLEARGYMSLATLLVLAHAARDEGLVIFQALRNHATTLDELTRVVTAEYRQLVGQTLEIFTSQGGEIGDLRHYVVVAARFSFTGMQ